MDLTLVILAATLAAAADGSTAARADLVRGDVVSGEDGTAAPGLGRPFTGWKPAASLDEVVVRAQSLDSPYYDELPPPGGGPPQYPYTPGSPSPGTFTPGAPGGYAPAPYAAPGYAPPAYGTPYQAAPAYDPFVPPPVTGPGAGGFTTYGANGPAPHRFGWAPRFDLGYITQAGASGPYGDLDVVEYNTSFAYATPTGPGGVFTVTPEFNLRLFDGPKTRPGVPGFPNDLYRFGLDFEYAVSNPGGVGAEVGFTPSLNTDFEQSPSSEAFNFDARAALLFPASPQTTVVLGAMYLDRVDDRILPYAGIIYLPNDRWELRLVFPNPRITYFAGHAWGKPMWVYLGLDYNIEAYEVEVPPGSRNQVQLEDWRLVLGARKDQGWGTTFLEVGYVFNREVELTGPAPDFEIGDAVLLRGGVTF